MVKRQGRHTIARKLRVALEALVGKETFNQCLNCRTPAEQHYVL